MSEGLNLPCGARVLRQMPLVPSLLSQDFLGSVSCLWGRETGLWGRLMGHQHHWGVLGSASSGQALGAACDGCPGYGHLLPLPTLTLLPPRRDSTKPSAGFKRMTASNIDYTELLQHFEKVQNKHLEARHQRAGRAEQLDRRVIL